MAPCLTRVEVGSGCKMLERMCMQSWMCSLSLIAMRSEGKRGKERVFNSTRPRKQFPDAR